MHAIVFAAIIGCALAAPQAVFYNAAPAVIGATSSQFHAQDELGQYSYGYSGGPSAKSESKDAAGNVRGQYTYIDSNGLTQVVNYVADPVNGFRVAATNLPVGPAAAQAHAVVAPLVRSAHHVVAPHHVIGHPHHVAVAPGGGSVHVAPLPIDTPEVTAAKINHAHAHAEALARAG